MTLEIRELAAKDRGYAVASWQESHKESPGCDRVPWSYYKHAWGSKIKALVNDPSTMLLGAYGTLSVKLYGWLAATPGKRVDTLHWVHVKYELDGARCRRQGVASQLIDAADLGSTFIYTMRGRRKRERLPNGEMSKSLDELLVAALGARGVTATYVALKDWL